MCIKNHFALYSYETMDRNKEDIKGENNHRSDIPAE
jgi:hypothetical protein